MSRRRLLHRPVAAGPRAVVTHAHGDHRRPGCGGYPGHGLGAAVARAPVSANACSVESVALWRDVHLNGVEVSPAPGRAHPRLGAGAGRASGRGLGRLRRLQACSPTRPARRSSRSAATRSSPSPPSACRSTAGPRRERLRRDQRLVAREPGAGQGQRALRLCPGQGAARPRRARRRRSARSSPTARSSG